MRPDDVLGRVGDNLGVRRVFGEPVERDGTTVVPVAMVIGGGGAGEDGEASGGGFGGLSRGIGVYTIRGGEVRFVPAVDRTLLVVLGLLVWGRVMARILRRRRAG